MRMLMEFLRDLNGKRFRSPYQSERIVGERKRKNSLSTVISRQRSTDKSSSVRNRRILETFLSVSIKGRCGQREMADVILEIQHRRCDRSASFRSAIQFWQVFKRSGSKDRPMDMQIQTQRISALSAFSEELALLHAKPCSYCRCERNEW